MAKFVNAVVDSLNDSIEKVSSPSSRAGFTVERAGRMLEEGVSPSVVALQMTENSPNGKKYTISSVQTLGDLYQDSKTKVVLTAGQTRGIINDQRESSIAIKGAVPKA